jgi:hypothetical protein
MKTIKTTHIDNGGHGYLSVSKKDILLVYNDAEIKEISGYSGMDWNRVYLEEDMDASNFIAKCKEKNITLEIKSGYNLSFKISHNYNPNLFYLNPIIGETFKLHDDLIYTIVQVEPKIIISNRFGQRYKLQSNPFRHIKDKN